MTDVVFDQVIETDFGQFDLGWEQEFGFDGDFDRFFAGQVNGLVGAADGRGVYLNLARRSGGSPVRIELFDAAPDFIAEDWEDVVEVSIRIPSHAEPRWSSWAGGSGGSLPIPPGAYRLRVCARGRDAGRAGEFADGPVDFYLLQLWPAPTELDSIVRVGSADAVYWHAEVGGRRL
jgi:hypothetical protein